MSDILSKIKTANLVGRGGAGFPTADKWSMVKSAKADVKYVVCNCSEGEPNVKKDGFIIEQHVGEIINGMKLAIGFLSESGVEAKGVFYLNDEYFHKYKAKLKKEIEKAQVDIKLFKKPHIAGYIGGEETTALNVIEGKRAEPRLRPPFPTTFGLHGMPTLVNNVETFYNVSLVSKNKYKKTRFYTLAGDLVFSGVYDLPENYTIEKILKQTNNYPSFPFFVQVGGDGAGEVLNSKQLKQTAIGSASIHVYSLQKYQSHELILKWIDFFKLESCGQCTPCREGTFRLKEALLSKELNWDLIKDLLVNLKETAFCGLGSAVAIPVESYMKNILNNNTSSV